MPHLLHLSDWPIPSIHHLLDRAEAITDGHVSPKSNDFVVNLFFEPSTRTHYSFEVAEKRLGMHVLHFDHDTSSTKKGETLYDTLRFFEEIGARIAVIRHPDESFYNDLKDRLSLSIINGGDGAGHHPTQSLLDLLTIRQEFGKIEGLTIAFIGDLRHSRVAHSNAEILTKMGATVLLSGPPEWQTAQCPGKLVSIDEAIRRADVVNMLRIQSERHKGEIDMSAAAYHKAYGLTLEREKLMKPDAIIMHPAPFNRNVEIADDLVECPRSRIFKQMHNGVPVRMAVLEWALGAVNDNHKEEVFSWAIS
ncbi:aspartate carbamoyltransferase catalytic subunit [Camelliibacillus cellulosilyticus]|uniref:Aspartate carbamoyltransferase n=1 Tax=Camelliibacillus cellulosilyticus TaxID=2174486 RepID=A0ABV9GH92_9BACL